MKLSSAFDQEALLDGCTGKTEPVAGEVAAISGETMSFLDKANKMNAVENMQDLSNTQWSNIFNLSDDDGVNTIAYGSSGAIYGCYNYNNMNVASYSKSYTGNDIFASAYSVGSFNSVDDNHQTVEVKKGLMLSITQSGAICLYKEDEQQTKSWATLSISGLSECKLYNIFSAGRAFFIASSAGLIYIDASNIDTNNYAITAYTILTSNERFPSGTLVNFDRTPNTNALKGILYIRERELEFALDSTPKQIKCYIMAWTVDGINYGMIFQHVNDAWNYLPLNLSESNTTISGIANGTIADIIPLSGISFPKSIETKSPTGYSETISGESIKLVPSSSVSILSTSEVENAVGTSNEWTIYKNGISSIAENTPLLKIRTPNNYKILAYGAISNNISNTVGVPYPAPNDRTVPCLWSFNESDNTWRYVPLWTPKPLEANEPLPKTLIKDAWYWVKGSSNDHFAKWFSDYLVKKTGNTEVEPVIPEDLTRPKDFSFVYPETSVQLFNDTREASKVEWILDVTNAIDTTKTYVYGAKIAIQVPFKDTETLGISYNEGIAYFQDLVDPDTYVAWNSEVKEAMTVVDAASIPSEVSKINEAVFDMRASNVGGKREVVKAYSKIIKIHDKDSETTETDYIAIINEDGTKPFILNLFAEQFEEAASRYVRFEVGLNDPTQTFIDKSVPFKLLFKIQEKELLDFMASKPIELDFSANPDDIAQQYYINPEENPTIPSIQVFVVKVLAEEQPTPEPTPAESDNQTPADSDNQTSTDTDNPDNQTSTDTDNPDNQTSTDTDTEDDLDPLYVRSYYVLYWPSHVVLDPDTSEQTVVLDSPQISVYNEEDYISSILPLYAEIEINPDATALEMQSLMDSHIEECKIPYAIMDSRPPLKDLIFRVDDTTTLYKSTSMTGRTCIQYEPYWTDKFAYEPYTAPEPTTPENSEEEPDPDAIAATIPNYVVEASDTASFINKRIFYSITGIIAKQFGKVIGNTASGTLRFSNEGNEQLIVLSERDSDFIKVLEKSEENSEDVPRIIYTHNYAIEETDGTRSIDCSVGTIDLQKVYGTTAFVFTKDQDLDVPVPQINGSSSLDFVPKLSDGSEYIISIPFAKTISWTDPDYSYTLEGSVSLRLTKATVVDRLNWTGSYTEKFNDCYQIMDDQIHVVALSSKECLKFSRQDALKAGPDDVLTPIPFVKLSTPNSSQPFNGTLHFVCNANAFDGCIGKGCIISTNAASNDIAQWEHASYSLIEADGLILGNTKMWDFGTPSADGTKPFTESNCLAFLDETTEYYQPYVKMVPGEDDEPTPTIAWRKFSVQLVTPSEPEPTLDDSGTSDNPSTSDDPSTSDNPSTSDDPSTPDDSGIQDPETPASYLILKVEDVDAIKTTANIHAFSFALENDVPIWIRDEGQIKKYASKVVGEGENQQIVLEDVAEYKAPTATINQIVRNDASPIIKIDGTSDLWSYSYSLQLPEDEAGINNLVDEKLVNYIYLSIANELPAPISIEMSRPEGQEVFKGSFSCVIWNNESSLRSLDLEFQVDSNDKLVQTDGAYEDVVYEDVIQALWRKNHVIVQVASDGTAQGCRLIAETVETVNEDQTISESTTYKFGSIIYRDIPDSQYQSLYQLKWEAAQGETEENDSVKKIVKWKEVDPNSTLPTPGFTLYVQQKNDISSQNSESDYIDAECPWVKAVETLYDSSVAHTITQKANPWPIFTPTVGSIHKVTQSHLSDSSEKYDVGYYMYVHEGNTLTDCYIRLPQMEASAGGADERSWRDWLQSQKQTYVMALIASENGSYGKIGQIIANSDNLLSFNPSFKWTQGQGQQVTKIWNQTPNMDLVSTSISGQATASSALPTQKCRYSSIVDPTSGVNQHTIYVGITYGTNDANIRIAFPQTYTFAVPKIAGTFSSTNSSTQTFAISDAIQDIYDPNDEHLLAAKNLSITSLNSDLIGSLSSEGSSVSILSMNTRKSSVVSEQISNDYMVWLWEASVNPYTIMTESYGNVYVVGLSGTTYIKSNPNGTIQTATFRTIPIQSQSLMKGNVTEAKSSLPIIWSPYDDGGSTDAANIADTEVVFYDEYGFHVKSSGISSTSEYIGQPSPAALAGTDMMTSISTIRDMITFKAYNAPIVVGLYDTGGLILYYGMKCFDRSILTTDRFGFDADKIDADSKDETFDSFIEEKALSTIANGGSYLAGILSSYIGNESDSTKRSRILTALFNAYGKENISFVNSSTMESVESNFKESYISDMELSDSTSSESNNERLVQTAIENRNKNKVLSTLSGNELIEAATAEALLSVETVIVEQEERSHSQKEADENFINSHTYSVNNSTTSQWINIPIYVQSGSDYMEVTERLTSLTSISIKGRIRLMVGSVSGNVYWRDLNPLHADKYLSYIPTGMLTQQEQNAIHEAENKVGAIPETNDDLKKFLDGPSAEDIKCNFVSGHVGWTNFIWKNTSGNAIASEPEKYIALAGSTLKTASGSQYWLHANGNDEEIKLSAANATRINNNEEDLVPHIIKRTWKWMIGNKETDIPLYANEPIIKKVGTGSSAQLIWHVNDRSTGIVLEKNKYPFIKKVNNVERWHIGMTDGSAARNTGVAVQRNGKPYLQDRTWMYVPYDPDGKAKAVKLFDLDQYALQVQTIAPTEPKDIWGIDGEEIGLKLPSVLSDTVAFTARKHQVWTFKEVAKANSPDTRIARKETQYDDAYRNAPYSIAPSILAIADEYDEKPVWTSTMKDDTTIRFNNACVEYDMFYVEHSTAGKWKIRAVESATMPDPSNPNSTIPLESKIYSNTEPEDDDTTKLPYYIAKTGRSWWLLPPEKDWILPEGAVISSRIGPYTLNATPQSRIGTRWTFTSIDKTMTKTWDSFEVQQGAIPELIELKDGDGKNTGTFIWTIDGAKPTFHSDSSKTIAFDGSVWQLPTFSRTIWEWTIPTVEGKIVTTSMECPFKERPEYGMWSNGTLLRDCSDLIDPKIEIRLSEKEEMLHWHVDGIDTGYPCTNADTWTTTLQWPSELNSTSTIGSKDASSETDQWKFEWKVPINGVNKTIATTNSCHSPLTKEKGSTLWITSFNKNPIDTGYAAADPTMFKGLEMDGIASKKISSRNWNEETKTWETTDPQITSWTPLASLFVDAFEEVSYGTLHAIKKPWSEDNMKKGMAWEMVSSTQLFDVENVEITDIQSNSWDTGKSSGSNSSKTSVTVYVGSKLSEGNQSLYDSYVTIAISETGASVKWNVKRKEWKFQNVHLVKSSTGEVTNIIILCTRGWIVSSKHLTLTEDGKGIRSVVWNNPVNPVVDVIYELEKIQAYKWMSWDSNTEQEFAAVGSYGVYVYSPDCQTFKASMPYGEDSYLYEIIWNEDNQEFRIIGVAPAVGDSTDEATVIEVSSEKENDEDSENEDDDFETAYESGAVNSARPSAISISSLSDTTIYKHSHKNKKGEKEVLWYTFSKATTSFTELTAADVTEEQKKSAVAIVADLEYRFSGNGKTWKFIYSKCNETNNTVTVLGASFSSATVEWRWRWSRTEVISTDGQEMAYITISENQREVAYGFPDLQNFIANYKHLYTDSMEFVGSVSQFASSEHESANADGKALQKAYQELVDMGGLKMYSKKLNTAWKIYKNAKRLRNRSHYAENDCHDTYLQKIGQSLALEYKDYFNRAKQAMWTAQAFRNYYEKLSKEANK